MNDSAAPPLEGILKRTHKTNGQIFSEKEIDSLSLYYRLVLKWNRRLHLTTITQPKAFVQRHICESEFAAHHLSISVRQVWDLGTGLGVPGIPIALLRPDLSITLVEIARAKTIFLEEAISELRLKNAGLICARIESLDRAPRDSALTARAIERMDRLIPEILRLGGDSSQILIFGTPKTGPRIVESLAEGMRIEPHPIPGSERRVLYEIYRS